MNNRLITNTIEKNSPLVVEIIGPAGSGKTTLLKTLIQNHNKVQLGIHPSKIRQFPFFISNTFFLLPIYLLQCRHSRWFTWRESRSMAYLRAGLQVIERQVSNNDSVVVLDHGPIYRLAFLRALGPEITTSQFYMNWWVNLINKWMATLDILIWLDAPNAILLDRIRTRDTMHIIKEKCNDEADEFLTHYRTFLTQTITEFLADNEVLLLQFDTNKETPGQIASQVLNNFDSIRQ